MPRSHSERMLTSQDIINGLSRLDEAFEASELIMSVAPIRFLTIGGMLAVIFFQNRTATKDIDFLLDPNVDAVPQYRDEVLKVIRGVARRQGFNNDWMNDDMKIFIKDTHRPSLFLQSVQQNIVVFNGKCLTVFAARLDFALERKLRRVHERSNDRSRAVDLSDAVSLVHYLKGNSHPLDWQYLRGLDENKLGIMVGDAGIQTTATEYLSVYGSQGIVKMEWDETYSCYKYINLEGNLVWAS